VSLATAERGLDSDISVPIGFGHSVVEENAKHPIAEAAQPVMDRPAVTLGLVPGLDDQCRATPSESGTGPVDHLPFVPPDLHLDQVDPVEATLRSERIEMECFGVDVMIGAGHLCRRGEKPYWPRPARSAPRLLPDPLGALMRSIWFTPSNLLVRREALRLSGGCDERVFVQDYSLALRLARRCRFGVSDALIIAAPDPVEIAADRLSANKAQILHDLNLALLLFIEDYPDLPAHFRRRAWRRIAGRSWKWARREVGRPLWSHELALCLGAHFPRVAHGKCLEFLQTFAGDGRVRRPVIAELSGAAPI